MLTSIPAGGMCNRLQNIISALVYSEETGTKVNFIWNIHDEVGSGKFTDYFVNDERFTSFRHEDVLRVLSGGGISSSIKPGVKAVHFWGFTHVDGEGDDFNGYPNGYNRFLRGVRRSLIKPLPHIIEAVDEYCTSNDISNRIGVHIRDFETSCDFTGGRDGRPNEMLDNFTKVMGKDNKFFLASDSSRIRDSLTALYPDLVYRKANDTGSKYAERNTIAGTTSGLIDLLILSRCRSMIGTRGSSFSNFAALMGGIPLKWVDCSKHFQHQVNSPYWFKDITR